MTAQDHTVIPTTLYRLPGAIKRIPTTGTCSPPPMKSNGNCLGATLAHQATYPSPPLSSPLHIVDHATLNSPRRTTVRRCHRPNGPADLATTSRRRRRRRQTGSGRRRPCTSCVSRGVPSAVSTTDDTRGT